MRYFSGKQSTVNPGPDAPSKLYLRLDPRFCYAAQAATLWQDWSGLAGRGAII